MADQVTNYKCPACYGPMHYSASEDKLVCDYCGSKYTVEDVESLYKKSNEAAAQAKEQADAKAASAPQDEWEMTSETWNGEGMMSYSCPQCGAELICDKTQAAFSCPYCGSPTTVPGQFSGMLKPEYIIPFKFEKNQALDALKKHYGKRYLLPGKFKDGNHLEEVKGVYVPFWLYDGVAEGDGVYEAVKTKTFERGNEEITEHKIYRAERSGRASFEKIPADASTKMDDALMDSIEPYDYKGMKPFAQAYLTGFLADRYDVSAEENKDRACERAKTSLKNALKRDVSGYDTVTAEYENVHVTAGKVTYALMPAWLLHTKWNDRDFMFAMNGQTGKMVGDLPVSAPKLGITAVVIAAIVTAISYLVGVSIGFSIGIGLVVAALVSFGLYQSMKSVAIAGAADSYVTEEGTEITYRTDDYIRTDVERRRIERDDKV